MNVRQLARAGESTCAGSARKRTRETGRAATSEMAPTPSAAVSSSRGSVLVPAAAKTVGTPRPIAAAEELCGVDQISPLPKPLPVSSQISRFPTP